MKEIEIQTEDKNKEIIKSSIIKIDENSDRIKVIVSVDGTLENMNKIHLFITKALEDNAKVITIPSFVKINTIKVQYELK